MTGQGMPRRDLAGYVNHRGHIRVSVEVGGNPGAPEAQATGMSSEPHHVARFLRELAGDVEQAGPIMTREIEAAEAGRERVIALLRHAAEGRREYADRAVPGSQSHTLLLASAEGYEGAAQLIENPERLLDLIPSWRWTDEEHASIRKGDPS